MSSNSSNYDVIIIGAGPSGIFCAYELIQQKPDLKILMVEKGRRIENRTCPMQAMFHHHRFCRSGCIFRRQAVTLSRRGRESPGDSGV